MSGRPPQPRFLRAVLADARVAAANQGRPLPPIGNARLAVEALRLAYRTDAFAGHIAYRAEARLRSLGLPLLPTLLRGLAILLAQIRVDPAAVVRPGVYIAHGQILITGDATVGPEVVLSPFAQIGPAEPGGGAPRIGARARIGSGARVLGPVEVGEGARLGANALVLDDVPSEATAVGVPARIVTRSEG